VVVSGDAGIVEGEARGEMGKARRGEMLGEEKSKERGRREKRQPKRVDWSCCFWSDMAEIGEPRYFESQ